MCGTPPALQIADENFLPVDRDVARARSKTGKLSKDEHRPSNLKSADRKIPFLPLD